MCLTWDTYIFQFSSVKSLSHVQLLATPWKSEQFISLTLKQIPSFPSCRDRRCLHTYKFSDWGWGNGYFGFPGLSSVQFSSVTQSCPTLCNPMDWSIPGFPVHHQLPELVQTHVHWVGDAIQPSHSLSSPSPSALNHCQHEGLLKWVSSSHQVAKEL